jgi:alpha-mannosidase
MIKLYLMDLGKAICMLFAIAVPTSAAEKNSAILWSLGTLDGSSIEFAPGARDELLFKIGESVLSRDFAGHQVGTIGWDPDAPETERPYSVGFDLSHSPAGVYHLTLNLIYKTGAAKRIQIEINDKKCIYPISPIPKQDVDAKDGNAILLAKQQLLVPIKAAWLKPAGNRITIVPLGFGTMDYDSLSLRRGASSAGPEVLQPRLVPTLFFRKQEAQLTEVCQLQIPFTKYFENGSATLQLEGKAYSFSLDAEGYDAGILSPSIEIAALDTVVKAKIEVSLDGETSSTSHTFKPTKRWKLYLCPKIHNDIGFTDIQPHVNELDTRNTDTVLSILAEYPFYKFNFETSWLVENYLDCRPEKYRQEFLQRAREGRAPINAFYLNLLTGVCTGEELYRSLYYTHALHLKHGTGFDYACLTDAPSHSWFLPTLLTDVGIKVFSNGSNQARAPILVQSNLNEVSPFYWEGINGERILMWYARVYAQWKLLTAEGFLNRQVSYDYLKGTLPQFLTRYLREDYAPDAVMVYGAYIDNASIPPTAEAEFVEKWNQEYAYPRLIVASDAEYFEYVTKNFSDQLPVYRGDAGSFWEDGVASSSQATAKNRQTQQILPMAEISSSLATMFEPRYRYPTEDFHSAWKNVLFYDEHTWGAFNSISQPEREGVLRQWEVKQSYSDRANLDARNLQSRSLNRLCQQIGVEGNTIFAFNWQNRIRTEPLVVELSAGSYLLDLSTDKPVETDVLFEKEGWKKVRFLAEHIPAMGYRGYAIRYFNAPKNPPVNELHESRWGIENPHYRLTLDRNTGGINSLIDKAEQRELVDQVDSYSLNQYLYVSGGKDSLIKDLHFGSPPAELIIAEAGQARLIENVDTPLGQRIVVETSANNTPSIRSEYLLYDRIKRVDIVNTVQKEATRDKEAVYFAFPLAADKPKWEYQIQNGWVRPNEDQLPGACREWFAVQNLVHLQDGDFSVAWSSRDAPLVNFTDINRGKWLTQLEITTGHFFSYVMNNYWYVNYKATQGGEFIFRYSITSGNSLSREQLADFDSDTRVPILAYPYLSSFSASVAKEDRLLQASSASLLQLEATNLQIVTLKRAEDGVGYILRILETAGRSGIATLRSPLLRIEDAYLCNGVEVNQKPLEAIDESAQIPYQPYRYITVRLVVGSPEN